MIEMFMVMPFQSLNMNRLYFFVATLANFAIRSPYSLAVSRSPLFTSSALASEGGYIIAPANNPP
jgi:hypothetical protein